MGLALPGPVGQGSPPCRMAWAMPAAGAPEAAGRCPLWAELGAPSQPLGSQSPQGLLPTEGERSTKGVLRARAYAMPNWQGCGSRMELRLEVRAG